MLQLFSLQCQGPACCLPLLISHTQYTLNFLLCPQSPKLPSQCLQSSSTGHAILATKAIGMDYLKFCILFHTFYRDGGAWWAAVYGVTQSRTQLKQLSRKPTIRVGAWS